VEGEGEGRDLGTWKILLVFLIGVEFGFLVLLADYHWWNETHRDFARTGPFVLWASLMCAQTGLWALALSCLAPSIKRLRELYGRANRTEVRVSTAIILALILWIAVGRPYVSVSPNYMPGHASSSECSPWSVRSSVSSPPAGCGSSTVGSSS
jgi:hypothetical protein